MLRNMGKGRHGPDFMQESLQAICSTLKVLVIDDDSDIVDVVSAVLRDMKIQTIWTAADGDAGLDIFRQVHNQVDLIVCDWVMPGVNGLDFLRHVRESNTSVTFIMLTAKATPESIQAAKKFGVNAFVMKPFEPLDLRKKILALLKAQHPEIE